MDTPYQTLTGQLNAFFETGTEGVVWSIIMDGVPGYDGLFCLKQGDELLVYTQEKQVAWRGTIELEFKSRWRPYPLNPKHGQQEVGGMWVNGLQKNEDPDAWAKLFFLNSPAVARVKDCAGIGSVRKLKEALAILETSPVEAMDFLERQDPQMAARIVGSIPHTWNWLSDGLGWPRTPLESREEKARAWQIYLAASRARRAAGPSTARDYACLKQQWPSLDSVSDQQVAYWCAHRLPHDDELDAPSKPSLHSADQVVKR